MCASVNGHSTTIKKLVSLGSNINYQNNYGRTALHWAASRGEEDAIRQLITLKAKLDIITR